MTHSNFPSSLCFCVLSYAGAEEQQNSQAAAAVGGDGGGNLKSDNEALTLEHSPLPQDEHFSSGCLPESRERLI